MPQNKQHRMGTEPVGKLLITMSLPTIFSMLINSLYNVVDSIFVAQIGEQALTAVSLAMPLQMLIVSVAVGTGIGVNSLISRKLGEKHFEEADMGATHGIILGVVNWIFFAVIGLFGVVPFFGMFTDDSQVLSMAVVYTQTVLIGSFGVCMSIAIEKIVQGTGHMNYPMYFQLTGAIINLILDPIFIFGLLGVPAMGVRGAALATVIGQFGSMGVAVWVITTKKLGVTIHFKGFKLHKETLGKIYSVGFPSMIMQSIGSVLTIALNGILIGFSQTAVSILGIYFKLQSFVFMPVFGLTQGILPLFGYNYGAANKKRLDEITKWGTCIAVGIMLVGTLIFQFFATPLLLMFNASPNMLELGVPALRIISSSFVLAGVGIVCSTLFQAIGHGKESLLISVVRQLVMVLPVAYFGAKAFGVIAVWLAFPIAETVALVLCGIIFRKVYVAKIATLSSTEKGDN